DARHDVLDAEIRRVDLVRIRRGLHAIRVRDVALAEIGGERVGADAGPLRAAPARADLAVGGEVDLHLCVGRHHGADVAPLDDDVPLATELPLPLAHHLA